MIATVEKKKEKKRNKNETALLWSAVAQLSDR